MNFSSDFFCFSDGQCILTSLTCSIQIDGHEQFHFRGMNTVRPKESGLHKKQRHPICEFGAVFHGYSR